MGFGKGMSFEHGVSIGIYLFNFAFENLWGWNLYNVELMNSFNPFSVSLFVSIESGTGIFFKNCYP
jgi:hypothetical protein